MLRTLASGDSAARYVDVNRRYGALARIGPNHLLTSDAVTTQRILAARSRYTRSAWYDSLRLDPHRSNLVTERDTRKHNVLRHQMSKGYGGKDIEGVEPAVDVRLREWIDIIDRNWVSGPGETKRFDIARSVQFLTTDIISHLCFGKPLGFVKNEKDMHGFLQTLESRLPIIEHFSVLTELSSLLLKVSNIPFLKRMLIPCATDQSGVGRIIGVSRDAVNRRFEKGAVPQNDMLGSFLQHGVDRDQVESEITVSLFAGSDTTATAIRATLLNIITNPPIYAKLQREIDDAIARGAISSTIQSEEAVRELPYLQACIKEGLRVFPPITALRERTTPPEGDTINGFYIPGGVNIGLNMRGVLLDKVFGPDADVFRPERWLDQNIETLKEKERVHELVFGHGFTRCLGIPIATMNLNKVFVELLRRYDVAVLNPSKPWISRCHGIFFQRDFFVRITRRPGALPTADVHQADRSITSGQGE
ncbi:hypothetical protein MMC11_007459 [Xylographa trunciseda]|nr:hypothetical protein [Xylographa trunciseda]